MDQTRGGYGSGPRRPAAAKREFEHRNDIVEVGRRLYQKGFIAAADGNVSVRLSDDRILTTPSGRNKGRLGPEDLVVTDMEGRRLYGTLEPSSELAMHLVMYRERPDVGAVVHAHPPHASGFAVAGIPMEEPLLSEVVLTLGTVPLAEYGTPTTPELAEAVRPYACFDGILLANHGALTVGSGVHHAYDRMETLEHSAHIYLVARTLGSARPLSAEHVAKLQEIRGRLEPAAAGHACLSCRALEDKMTAVSARLATPGPDGRYDLTRDELIDLITDVVNQL
ncbi:MAG TPA: class II aldolase/adducin family protein [Candidatus Polarisedimenticolia bacterium]|nr:class II aldolase/adducin family protein [Candidatus Polarisedimenticolia bacterium]